MKSLLITIALAAAFVAPNPAAAQPATTRTAAVSTVGLDLATDRGQRALGLRILHASSELCGTPSPADPRGRIKLKDCRNALHASAAEQARFITARNRGAVEVAAR